MRPNATTAPNGVVHRLPTGQDNEVRLSETLNP
jgi:hypothetical protein